MSVSDTQRVVNVIQFTIAAVDAGQKIVPYGRWTGSAPKALEECGATKIRKMNVS